MVEISRRQRYTVRAFVNITPSNTSRAKFLSLAVNFDFLLVQLRLNEVVSNTYARLASECFQRFKTDDFDIENRHGGEREKDVKDAELEALEEAS